MINKLGIYITCQACKRKVNEISQQKSLKCKNCGVRQRQAECKLLVHLDDKDVWLTAFTDVLESLFATQKEDCVLEGETATATIHVWDPLINKIKSGTTYVIENLTVKHFQGITHVQQPLKRLISS